MWLATDDQQCSSGLNSSPSSVQCIYSGYIGALSNDYWNEIEQVQKLDPDSGDRVMPDTSVNCDSGDHLLCSALLLPPHPECWEQFGASQFKHLKVLECVQRRETAKEFF